MMKTPMTKEAKITIGLCVKNAEHTIKEAIRSILTQDYPHKLLEIIIVDGSSKDETLSIIKEELSGSKVKSRVFNENKGLGYARQLVVDNAEGRYIIWVDSDMIIPRNFISKQVEFMESHSEVGIAKGRFAFLEEKSLVANLENLYFLSAFQNKNNEQKLFPLGTSGCIYRVKAIRQAGGFDENIRGVGEDMDAEYRVKVSGWKLSISPATFYEKRRRTWRSLWDEYFWHGKGAAYLFKKRKEIFLFNQKMFPLTSIFNKLIETAEAYRLTNRKEALLLPFHYAFKRFAWTIGFLMGKLKE